MTTPALFEDWARQALRLYDLREPTVRLIGQNEAVTFEVVEPSSGARALLRIHQPTAGTWLGLRQQPAAIASELRWLLALGRETPLLVQQPIATAHGSLVGEIGIAAEETLPCSLLTWPEGWRFDQAAPQAACQAAALGRMVAWLHSHASGWSLPEGFVRPIYSRAFFHQLAENLQPGVSAGVIQPNDYAIIRQTMASVSDLLAGVARNRNTWGLVHNDLHVGNWLVGGDEAVPVDFSLCGFSFFLFDLGMVLASLDPRLREPFLDAYGAMRPLPEDTLAAIEACFIASRFSGYGVALPNSARHDWLKTRIPQVVATICRPFLQQQSFVFAVR